MCRDSRIRKVSGSRKGARIVAVPFQGGVILVDLGRKNFVGSLKGFAYNEERHEASKFLLREDR